MKQLSNNEYCHKNSFVFDFKPKQSILDYITPTDKIINNKMTYKQFVEYVKIIASKLNVMDEPYVFPDVHGIEFMIIAFAGLLANKSILTSPDMIFKLGKVLVCQSIDDLIHMDGGDYITPNIKTGEVLFYTSGSTGAPKIVNISQLNIITGALGNMKDDALLYPINKALYCLPIVHTYEFMMETLGIFYGYELIYTSPPELYKQFMIHKPDMVIVVPQILNRLYDMKLKLPTNILVTGGAPIRPEVYEFFKEDVKLLINGYGATEVFASITTTTTPDDYYTNGTCVKSVIVKVSDDGELLVKGLSVPESQLHPDGWYHTRDHCTIENGRIIWHNRMSSVMKLQQGEFIDLDKLSEIYSKEFPVVVCANSLDRYPSAVVYEDNLTSDDIIITLNNIHKENKLRGFERIEKLLIRPRNELPYVDSGMMKINYAAVRREFK